MPGATRIDVTVEQGGSELIRVVDDGCGIAADELPLAVASHATSKIRDADDLFRVGTLGFRGEALASIAEVSRLVDSQPHGRRAKRRRARSRRRRSRSRSRPCGCPVGTTIEVRNLFFNTPVRHKFLRPTQTEMGHVSEAVTRLALAHPQIHFTLRAQRPADARPAAGRRLARADRRASSATSWPTTLIADRQRRRRRAARAASSPTRCTAARNNRMQYLFLNGRSIRDRSLQHALGEAYRGLLLTGRYPICFLRLDMPAELVDVNVHPTKLEVRFQDGGRLYSQLLGTLRTKFLTTDLTPKLQPAGAMQSGGAPIRRVRRRTIASRPRGNGKNSPLGEGSRPADDRRAAFSGRCPIGRRCRRRCSRRAVAR